MGYNDFLKSGEGQDLLLLVGFNNSQVQTQFHGSKVNGWTHLT